MALTIQSLFCMAAVLAFAIVPVSGQIHPNYAGCSDTQLIPFANTNNNLPPFSNPPELAFTVDGKPFTAVMDTGSTGAVISAADLPGYTTENASHFPQGWEFLSSSRRLWVGRWIRKEIVFQDAEVTATVPILAVEMEVICPHYNLSTDGAVCPPSGNENGTSPQPTLMPRNITYMGVGFGREHGGLTQGTPNKNPLLNINSANRVPVTKMRAGYVPTPEGVHVGLTSANTVGFVFVRLTGPKDSNHLCFFLVDTGIPQMALSLPGAPINVVSGSDPSFPGPFPNLCAPVAYYNLMVGDYSNPMQPDGVIVKSDGDVFVNTGRHFLRNFNVLFDADGGFFGLRWIESPDSSFGGIYLSPRLVMGSTRTDHIHES